MQRLKEGGIFLEGDQDSTIVEGGTEIGERSTYIGGDREFRGPRASPPTVKCADGIVHMPV